VPLASPDAGKPGCTELSACGARLGDRAPRSPAANRRAGQCGRAHPLASLLDIQNAGLRAPQRPRHAVAHRRPEAHAGCARAARPAKVRASCHGRCMALATIPGGQAPPRPPAPLRGAVRALRAGARPCPLRPAGPPRSGWREERQPSRRRPAALGAHGHQHRTGAPPRLSCAARPPWGAFTRRRPAPGLAPRQAAAAGPGAAGVAAPPKASKAGGAARVKDRDRRGSARGPAGANRRGRTRQRAARSPVSPPAQEARQLLLVPCDARTMPACTAKRSPPQGRCAPRKRAVARIEAGDP
jgi:hypothetical protein